MVVTATAFPETKTVLAIDPGTVKCGVAIAGCETGTLRKIRCLYREVIPTERLVARTLTLLQEFPDVERVLIGNATRGATLLRALRGALPDSVPVESVEEAFTSQRARERFRLENPPRGLMRLIPAGLRQPPRAYDDYVALLLAEDFFAAAER